MEFKSSIENLSKKVQSCGCYEQSLMCYATTCCLVMILGGNIFRQWVLVEIIVYLPVLKYYRGVICKSTCLETTSLQWSHLQNIQACLPQWPPFLQHVLWWCCKSLGILSSKAEILLSNLVFHDRVTPVSVSTLKPPLGVIGVVLLKPRVSPILSACI